MGKVLEQIVTTAICKHLDENHLLSDKHFGFRPGRSTADLLLLFKDWQDALEGSGTLLSWPWTLPGLLTESGTPGLSQSFVPRVSKVMCSCYSKTTSSIGPSSRPSPVLASVPKGSVLGLVLWNIFIYDLLQQLSSVAAYADDCTLSRSYCRPDSKRAVTELSKQLRLVELWRETWQVNFAAEKMQAMVISRSPGAAHAV